MNPLKFFNLVSMEIRMWLVRLFTQAQLFLIPAEASQSIKKHIRSLREKVEVPEKLVSADKLKREAMEDRFVTVDKMVETQLILRDMPDGSITLELRTDPARDIAGRIERGEEVPATFGESFATATIRVMMAKEWGRISEVTLPGMGARRPIIYKGHAILGEMTDEMKQMIDSKMDDVTGNTTLDRKNLH